MRTDFIPSFREYCRALSLCLLLQTAACTVATAAPRGFSAYPLRVNGRIVDYTFRDVNGDGENDVIVQYTSRSGEFAALFLHHHRGFSSDPNQIFPLGSDVIALNVANIRVGEDQDFCFVTRKGLVTIPFMKNRFRTDREKMLFALDVPDLAQNSRPVLFPLNHQNSVSGKNHLLIPVANRIHIYTQEKNGRFTRESVLDASGSVPLFGKITRESERGIPTLDGIRLTDLNGDGRDDLCSIHRRGCTFYLQKSDGTFPSSPTAAISFVQDETTRLLALADCNGDRLPDLVFLQEVKTGFLSNKKSTLGFHFGTRGESGTVAYKNVPDRQWSTTGVHLNPSIVDFNSDGMADLVVVRASYNFGNLLRALVQGRTKLLVEFYRSNRGEYPDNPDAVRETSLPGKIYDDPDFSPVVLFGDIDGDRRKDFILGEENAIFCYSATKNRLFEGSADGEIRPYPQAITEAVAWRINNDTKEDLCFIERKRNAGTLYVYLAR